MAGLTGGKKIPAWEWAGPWDREGTPKNWAWVAVNRATRQRASFMFVYFFAGLSEKFQRLN